MNRFKPTRARVALTVVASSLAGFALRPTRPEHDSSSLSSSGLNPTSFTPFTLVKKEAVSSSSSLFTLRPTAHPFADTRRGGRRNGSDENVESPNHDGVWSVQIKQPQLQIARDYTPLPPPLQPSSSSSAAAAPASASILSDPPESARSSADADANDIRLLIRREHRGEVSNYLHALPPGSTVEVRGSKTEFKLPDDVIDVVFLAGGTGIAPALQVASALYARDTERRRIQGRDISEAKEEGREGQGREGLGASMVLLWANRRREDVVGGVSDSVSAGTSGWLAWITGRSRTRSTKDMTEDGTQEQGLIVRQLETLKRARTTIDKDGKRHMGLQADYFVDEEGTFLTPSAVKQAIGSLNALRPLSHSGSDSRTAGRRLLIVSGPEGFVTYWAGPKQWINGREVQGPLGGVLGQIKLDGWEVVKL